MESFFSVFTTKQKFYLIGRKKFNKRTSFKTLIKIGLLKINNFGKVLIWQLEDAIYYTRVSPRVSHTFSSKVFFTWTSKLCIADQNVKLGQILNDFVQKKFLRTNFEDFQGPWQHFPWLKSKHVFVVFERKSGKKQK